MPATPVTPTLRSATSARLPTRYGEFTASVYDDPDTGDPHLALVRGALGGDLESFPSADDATIPLVRLHSECLTGDVLGSLRCDCGVQLDRALRAIAEHGLGVLLYLRQEGRGIGLHNKIRAYALQDDGLDTVEANEQLGLPADARDYAVAASMLQDLGVQRLRLLTNNPRKLQQLERHGLEVVERVPLVVPPTAENESYLATKRTKLGHLFAGS